MSEYNKYHDVQDGQQIQNTVNQKDALELIYGPTRSTQLLFHQNLVQIGTADLEKIFLNC